MKITRFHLQPYALPMAAPVELTHHTFDIKKGWFLVAVNDQNICARAEIPCLPTVHTLEYEEIPSALNPILDTITNLSLPSAPCWDRPLFGLLPPPPLPIQLLFALESLLLTFYRTQFLQHFNLTPHLSVPINELFVPNLFEIRTPIASTLKVKLPGLPDPASVLTALLAQKQDCRLRLDPNRTLTPMALKSLMALLPPDNLEYIEDPYPDLHQGLEQYDAFPLALDKELASALKSSRFPSNTVALVVKPGRDLALSGTLDLILKKKYDIVISSAYETPVGIAPLIHLAAVSKTPCGLDVQKLFRPSPSLPFHPLEDGQITLTTLPCEIPLQSHHDHA